MNRPAARLLPPLACWLCVASGCIAINRPPAVPMDSAASLFEKAQITYKVDAGRQQAPVSVARIEGQLVSYQQMPSGPLAGDTQGTLEIEYPHPRQRDGYALAKVTIRTKFPAGPAGAEQSFSEKMVDGVRQTPVIGKMVPGTSVVEEIWEYDVPRGQFDRAVSKMNTQRYFERHTKSEGQVEINARLDGNKVNKSWNRVDDLDQIMLDARAHGRLVSYKRSGSADQATYPPPESVAAYRAYAAQDAAHGAPSTGFLAGGPALPGVTANPQATSSHSGLDPRNIASKLWPKQREPVKVTRLPVVGVWNR